MVLNMVLYPKVQSFIQKALVKMICTEPINLSENLWWVFKNGEISDIDRVYLSVTDVVEIWRLFLWYCNITAQN